ncbi:MAG: OmpA family protein [Candidatus Aminicenantales bacterium]
MKKTGKSAWGGLLASLSLIVLIRAQDAPTITAYSKFDFVPGEKLVMFDDFTGAAIGDFPSGWDTNAAAEVVTIEGKPGRWLMLTKGGVFVPDIGPALPENFTLEFDLLASKPFKYGTNFSTSIAELSNVRQPAAWQGANNRFTFTVHPEGVSTSDRRQDAVGEAAVQVQGESFESKNGGVMHISVWRQKERVRVYANDRKIWDVPKAVIPAAKCNSIVFYVHDAGPDYLYYLSNVRLAVGAPDTRNKLLTEGKWVTRGILFDVNSDVIRGESYGTLKEIAGVLKENTELRLRTVGHTDADGDEGKNLDLSKRRAASVKSMLAREFGIADSRMETDGKGESQPTDKNDTAAGKANNRRVEFIKL